MGFAEDLVNQVKGTRETESGFAQELVEETVQRHFQPTEERDAVFNKPIKKFTGEGGSGASFATHLKQGFVDDPITKIKVYSESRFPKLSEEERMSRYRMQNGEVIFQADDGKWYSETPDMPHQKIKRFLGETTAHSPAIAGAVVGEVLGGPVSAGIVGGAGEAIRKGVGHFVFDDPLTPAEYLKSVGVEGGFSSVGSIPGRAVIRGARKVGGLAGGLKGARTVKAAGKELPTIDFKKAAKLQKYYKQKFGVDLFDAQTTESRRLLDKINLFGDLPQTADMVRTAKLIQDEQAFNAVDNFWNTISKPSYASEAGERLSDAAAKSIKRDVNRMVAAAKPHYDKAFKKNPKTGLGVEVNIVPHVKVLDDLIENSLETGPRRKKLEQFKRMLLRTVKVDGEDVLVPESRLKQLDELKRTVDPFLKPKPGDVPIDNQTKREIREIKNNILADLDVASPDYQKARAIWAGDAQALEKLILKTRLKAISSLEGNKEFVGASRQLFSNVGNDAKMMGDIRKRITKENPAVWDEIVRIRLEDIFESVKGSAEGGSANSAKLFNSFYRNTIGDARQNKLLMAAMGGKNSIQYKNFREFTDMLRRVGLISRRESTTAVRQESLREEKNIGILKTIWKVQAYPLITWKKITLDKYQQFATDRGKRLLAEALLDTRTHERLLKIKKMGFGTEAGLRAASTFASLVLGGEYRRHGTSLLSSREKE